MTTEIEKSEKKTSKTLSPFDDFDKFFERIFSRNSLRSRIGDNFFSDVFSDAEHAFPKIDLIEHKKEYVVKAELPGMGNTILISKLMRTQSPSVEIYVKKRAKKKVTTVKRKFIKVIITATSVFPQKLMRTV